MISITFEMRAKKEVVTCNTQTAVVSWQMNRYDTIGGDPEGLNKTNVINMILNDTQQQTLIDGTNFKCMQYYPTSFYIPHHTCSMDMFYPKKCWKKKP